MATVARAQEVSAGAGYLISGTDAYSHLEFDQARSAFAKALSLDPHLTKARMMLGLTDAKLGHCQAAIDEISASGENPDGEDAKVRERCRTLVNSGVGTVEIATTPPGAELRIDNAKGPSLGETPMRKDLSNGKHTLFLKAKGMGDLESGILVMPGETVAVNLAMFPPVKEEAKEGGGHTLLIVGVVVAAVVVVGVGLGVGLPLGLAHENPPMAGALDTVDLRK